MESSQSVNNEFDLMPSFSDRTEYLFDKLEEFKFLLHPTRMAIMRLLYRNYRQTTIEIKGILDVSWAKLSASLKKLEEFDFLSMTDEFHGTKVKQTIYLQELGRKRYEEFSEILCETTELN